jgi:glucose/arabinose dehydrogenase/endonuclease YncB( thermonuclease family)
VLLMRRAFVGFMVVFLLGVVAAMEPPQTARAGQIGPGGALAVSPGPKELTRGYAVDGDTIAAWIEGQQVAIGLVGVWTPQGNTPCGMQARGALQSFVKNGLRLEDDPTITIDGRKRRMYRALTLDGHPVAQELIRGGFARADTRGQHKGELAKLELEASTAGDGCVWSKGQPPKDLQGERPGEREKNNIQIWPNGTPPKPPARRGNPQFDNPLSRLLQLGQNAGDAILRPSVAAAQSAGLPPNFVQDTVIASGLVQPTNVAFLPDGRILIAEQRGVVKIYKDGVLLATPFIDLRDRVNDYFDHGLIGMAVDPDFANNGYVYLAYTYENDPNQYSGGKTARVARYTTSGDAASPSTEFVVLGQWVGGSCQAFPAGFDCIPSDDLSHSIGNIRFASDGTLFVTTGDGASYSVVDELALRAQNLDSLGGKVLHVTKTGQAVSSNPFFTGDANANRSKVWAYGFRNPYRFGLRPGSDIPYVGNVGWNNWEELDVTKSGQNMGWPCYEGPFEQQGYASFAQCQALYAGAGRSAPLHYYSHVGGSSAVTAGFFFTGTAFPAEYQGSFFYGDYGSGYINTLKVDANDNLVPNSIATFKAGTMNGANDGPVHVSQGPDGALYWVNIVAGQVLRIRFVSPGSPPTVVADADPEYGLLPLTVNFSSAGTNDPNGRPTTYDWDFGDGSPHSTAANPSHQYTTSGSYTAKLTVTNDLAAAATWTTTITAGSNPPTAQISTPASTLQYKVADVINYAGSATDFDGTPIPASSLDWDVIIHHCPKASCHNHFLLHSSGSSGTLTIPDHGDDVYLELVLKATNSAGLSSTSAVSIHPQLVTMTLQTVPAGLKVVYDGEIGTTPRTQQTPANSTHTLYAPSPQGQQGQATFGSWSDAGLQQHNVTMAVDRSFTATFNVTAIPNRSVSFNGAGAYAQSLAHPPLNITGDWTVEAWFKDEDPSNSYHHGDAFMFIKGDSNQDGEAPYMMSISWNYLSVAQRTGYVNYPIGYDLVAANVTHHAWHHAAATFEAATRTMSLYLDGGLVAQNTIAADTATGSSLPLSIGRNGTTGLPWNGKLDDIRIWNVLRTPAEISANYLTELVGAPTGLVSNWRFDEGLGTTANDSAGPATVTLNGGAAWSTDAPNGIAPTSTLAPTPGAPTATPTSTPTPGTATATSVPQNCPCTIWPNSAVPTNPSNADSSAVEVGVKFRSDVNGYITGLRFYKGTSNTGTHVGHIWTSTGTLLAAATFADESATGWQQVDLANPVAVTAGTTYVASYHADNGGYAADQSFFGSSVDRVPLHALASVGNGGNGVYAYTATGAFPTNTFNATNYWVDVVFNTTAASPTPTKTSTPGPPTATPTNTPTPVPSNCPCSLWPATAQAGSMSSGASVELGVKLRSDVAGFITGIRFYKPSGESGTHVVNLWNSTGGLLGSATSSGEVASGWQQVNFTSPIAVSANTTYVASYHSNGVFGYDLNSFSPSGREAPPLHVLADGASGGNGVYQYGGASAFPNNSYQASNYWVDVVFNTTTATSTTGPSATPTPTAGLPTSTPTPTSTSVPISCPCTIWQSSAVPANPANADFTPVEVGVKFRSDINGLVTGIRFYKGAGNSGTHVGNLWSSTGTLLATATFSVETATGWQQANFATPVAISANTVYVASYHTDAGRYAADQTYFAATGVDRAPLHALANGTSVNGVYAYGGSSLFPTNTYNATNYWVDVVFQP